MSGRMKCAVSSLKKSWKKDKARKKFTLTYKTIHIRRNILVLDSLITLTHQIHTSVRE